jgi:AcrR family transcriptional regulator
VRPVNVDIVHISTENVNTVHIVWKNEDMERPNYHHGSLEAALVETAVEVARAEGPAALSLRSIAATVGVSPAAVYRHFDSLDHLVAAVSQFGREEMARALIAARARPTTARTKAGQARQRMAEVGRAYIRFAIDEPRLFDTAHTACSVLPSRMDDPSAWHVLLDCVADLEATGVITSKMAAEAPIIAWAGVHGLANILVRGVTVEPLDVDAAIDTIVEALLRAVERPR